MIVDTRDVVFGGEARLLSRGMRFVEITNNQTNGHAEHQDVARGGERWETSPVAGQDVTASHHGQGGPTGNNNQLGSYPAPNERLQQSIVVDRARLIDLYFTCPLCQKILTEPCVLTACMHRFCRVCIESWVGIENSNYCPTCGMQYMPNNSSYMCRDETFEAMLREVLPPQGEGSGIQQDAQYVSNMNIGDGRIRKKRKATPSSLSKGLRGYMQTALQNRVSTPMPSLRSPSTIIMLSFDHITQMKWRYVTCPLKKTVWQLKQVIAKHIHQGTLVDDCVTQSLVFHLVLDARIYTENRKKEILDGLCPESGKGIGNSVTFGDIVHAAIQHEAHSRGQEYASSVLASQDTNSHVYVSPIQGMDVCPTNQAADATNNVQDVPGKDISNRWPLFLRHVSTCSFPLGKCPHGETCDSIKSLGSHIKICSDDECTFPRCQPWKGLVQNHSADCNNTGCLVCTLRALGDKRNENVCEYSPSSRPVHAALRPEEAHARDEEPTSFDSGVFMQLGGIIRIHVTMG